ncbi:MAG: response regulator transcription factor [Halioglobus sp.]
MSASVLIIDDDKELCALLSEFLSLEGFVTSAIHHGVEAVTHCQENNYDVIVLDIMLPGLQGLDVLRQVRQFSSTPILMLTARGEDTDRILGLELGADDYLAKPCNPRELAARLRAILRRSQITVEEAIVPVLEAGATSINPADRSATFNGHDLPLTSAEFNVLQVLISHAGKVVNKEILSQQALGRALSAYDRSIDVHVSKIRKKLSAVGGDNLIVSVRGSGYQFRVSAGDS